MYLDFLGIHMNIKGEKMVWKILHETSIESVKCNMKRGLRTCLHKSPTDKKHILPCVKKGGKWFTRGRIYALSLFNRLEYSPGWKLPGICEGESGHVILSSFTTWWHAARRASRSLIVIGESPDSSNPQEKRGKAGQPARASLLQKS